MEFVNKKTAIIEFNGLPGTGKTTISRLLAENLVKEYDMVFCGYNRHSYHDYTYSMFMSPLYYSRALKFFSYSRYFVTPRSIRYSLVPLKYLRMYDFFVKDKNNGGLIIDQGFIQGLISLAHNELFPHTKSLGYLLRTSGLNDLPIVIVNCNCSLDRTIDRLLTRPVQGSRLQLMNKEELKVTMTVQEHNLQTLRSLLIETCPNTKCVTIDTELSPEYNVGLIKNCL